MNENLEEIAKEIAEQNKQGNMEIITELAFAYKQADTKVKEIEKELKELKKKREELEQGFVSFLVNSMINKVSVAGVGTISLVTKDYVSIKAEYFDEVKEKLADMGHDYLVKETINSNTFRSWWMSEQEKRMEAGQPPLDEIFGDKVSIFRKQKLSLRRSR